MIIVSSWPYPARSVYTDRSVHLDQVVYTVYNVLVPDADDLTKLREQFPHWRIGSTWASAASGPDRRRLWARNRDVLVTAWTVSELRHAIEAAER